jgi:hypothetical protein
MNREAGIVDLSAADIQRPSRLSVDRVGRIMLWPGSDEADARERATAFAVSQFIVDAVRDGWAPMPESHADLAQALDVIVRGAKFSDAVHNEAKPRYFEGVLVGYMIGEMLYDLNERQNASSIGEAKRRALNKLRRAGSDILKRSFDLKRFDNAIWPRFRPVAHLWAAYIDRCHALRRHTFPCSVGDLPQFLTLAALILETGCQCKPKRSPVALLDKTLAWQPADEISALLPLI